MTKSKISEEIIKEVEQLLDENKQRPDSIEGSVIFDGKQYTLKIPKKVADSVGINPGSDKFIFKIENYPIEQKKKPSLDIELKRSEE